MQPSIQIQKITPLVELEMAFLFFPSIIVRLTRILPILLLHVEYANIEQNPIGVFNQKKKKSLEVNATGNLVRPATIARNDPHVTNDACVRPSTSKKDKHKNNRFGSIPNQRRCK